jgi:hypothetical protein
MPISYRIDVASRVVHARMEGKVTVRDIQRYRAQLQADPHFVAGLHRLVDARAIEHDFTRADIRRLADVLRVDLDQGRPTRRAILLDPRTGAWVMELITAYTRGGRAEYRTFVSEADAERWLGLEERGDDPAARFLLREPPPATVTLTPEETMPQERPERQSATDQEQRSGGYGDDTGMNEPRPRSSDPRAAETHGDSAVGREDPSTGPADADEALGNRGGGYGSGPEEETVEGTGLPDAD